MKKCKSFLGSKESLDQKKHSNQSPIEDIKKNFDARNFNGVLKVDEDALLIQKRLRDEWE